MATISAGKVSKPPQKGVEYLEQEKHTTPQILSLVSFMMNLLLNQMLMLRIIRVEHHNRLPPPLPLTRIPNLERRRRYQHRQRQPLRVNPSLHKLLRSTQIRIPPNKSQRNAHARDPAGRHNRIPVLPPPVLEPLEVGFRRAHGILVEGCPVPVMSLRIPRVLVVAGGAVGGDDRDESS